MCIRDSQDTAYFDTLSQDMQTRRDLLANGLRELGFEVQPCDGTYFLTVDLRSIAGLLQAGEDDVAWCKRATAEAGVTLIPVSAFYDPMGGKAPDHFVRFAFCKQPIVLEQALTRLRDWIARG